VDHKCPFTSDVSIRGRILTGTVRSAKMKRTIIIRRDYMHYIKKYQRCVSRPRAACSRSLWATWTRRSWRRWRTTWSAYWKTCSSQARAPLYTPRQRQSNASASARAHAACAAPVSRAGVTHASVAALLRDAHGAPRAWYAAAPPRAEPAAPHAGLTPGATHLGRDTAGWYLQQARGSLRGAAKMPARRAADIHKRAPRSC
jgi:hypothetical protein